MTDGDSSDQQARDLTRTTSIVLAEFAGLRAEIATRITILVTLILGNLTVLGVIFGIALNHTGDASILLLLPLITPCIGILVIDSFRNLDLLGRYIYRVIRPQLKIEGTELFHWELWINKHQLAVWFAGPFQLVLFLEFFGPPIAALIYTIQYHFDHPRVRINTLQVGLWWAGAALTGSLLLYAVSLLAFSMWHSQGSKKIRSSP